MFKVTVKKGKKKPSERVEAYTMFEGESSDKWFRRIAEALLKKGKKDEDIR